MSRQSKYCQISGQEAISGSGLWPLDGHIILVLPDGPDQAGLARLTLIWDIWEEWV